MKKIFSAKSGPSLGWKGKKILVMGLGLHGGGVGVTKFFCKQKADVLVTDLKNKEQLRESLEKLKDLKVRFTLGCHQEENFKWADVIIKNPDVPSSSPYLKLARKIGTPVETDVSLFFKLSRAFIIGVTGTKGKSTTASLIHHILKQKFKKVFLAGNIGVSPLELLPKIKKGDKVVLELSSFELEEMVQSPNIAVVTNILPDHLNRYATMSDYVESKKSVFKFQKRNNILILNEDNLIVRQFGKSAKGRVYFFSKTKPPKNVNLRNFRLFGEHNLSNLLAAVKTAEVLKISPKLIEKAIKTFKGVSCRQEFIGEVDGVKYFNDTTATMPDAAILAIKTFSDKFPNSKLTLICGGQNKGLQYLGLAREIREKVGAVILLPGTASEKIKEHLAGYSRIFYVFSMDEAVKKAKEISTKGDIVLLSPAAASFNLFKNEFDRGRQFVDNVKVLYDN